MRCQNSLTPVEYPQIICRREMYLTHKHAAITGEVIPLLYNPLSLFYHVTGTCCSMGQELFKRENRK